MYFALIVHHNNKETHHIQIQSTHTHAHCGAGDFVTHYATASGFPAVTSALVCHVSQVRIAKSYISCPIPECSGYLDEGVVISHLANEDVAKYRYFLELSQLDSSTKPCPQCSQFTSLKEHNPNRSEHKYKVRLLFRVPPTAQSTNKT